MLKNNNTKAVKLLVKRSMKENKMRNFFVILAVVISTFMFSSIFSIGFSLAKSEAVLLDGILGNKANIYIMNPDKQQLEVIKGSKYIKHGGYTMETANGNIAGNSDSSVSFKYAEEDNFKYNIEPVLLEMNGKYPENSNEILLPLSCLEVMGISEPHVNDEVSFDIDGVQRTFFLSGWYSDYEFTTSAYKAYVSGSFADSIGAKKSPAGVYYMQPKFACSKLLVNELMSKCEKTENIANDSPSASVYISSILACLIICTIILVSGYLLIYNIMYISINRDIRFYGMLKTIGTTPKQIKKMVKMQANYLALTGIPIGLLLSAAATYFIVPYALNVFMEGFGAPIVKTSISFDPLIFVMAAAYSMLTISFSCRKPSKIAASVSPVEALKYNGTRNENIKARKTTNGGKLHKMAFRNVFREKKKAVLVFASMLLGCLAFLCVQSFMTSLKAENYIEAYCPDDFCIFPNADVSPKSKPNEAKLKRSQKKNAAYRIYENVKKIDGIEDIMINYSIDAELKFDKETFRPIFEHTAKEQKMGDEYVNYINSLYEGEKKQKFETCLICIDEKMIERYNRYAEKKIDTAAFNNGDSCILLLDSEIQEMEGRTITAIDPENNNKLDMTVGMTLDINKIKGISMPFLEVSSLGAPYKIFVSRAMLDKLEPEPYIYTIAAKCDPHKEPAAKKSIKAMCSNNIAIPSLNYVSIKSESLASFNSSTKGINIIISTISFILIGIGMINLANVMLTGIYSRRRELAVMESVGMTKKQVHKMLMTEGLCYGGVMTILIFTIGSGLMAVLGKLSDKIADFSDFHFPWLIMILMSLFIVVICAIIPTVSYRVLSKDSVTDRLRMGD